MLQAPVTPLDGVFESTDSHYRVYIPETSLVDKTLGFQLSSLTFAPGTYILQLTGQVDRDGPSLFVCNPGVTLSIPQLNLKKDNIWSQGNQYFIRLVVEIPFFDLRLFFTPTLPLPPKARFTLDLKHSSIERVPTYVAAGCRQERHALFPADHHILHNYFPYIAVLHSDREYTQALETREALKDYGLYVTLLELKLVTIMLEACWQTKSDVLVCAPGFVPSQTLIQQRQDPDWRGLRGKETKQSSLPFSFIALPAAQLVTLLESDLEAGLDKLNLPSVSLPPPIPRVSRLLPESIGLLMITNNDATTLETTLSSLVTQSFPYFSLCILDCESKDATVNLLDKFALKDSRIKRITTQTKLSWEEKIRIGCTHLSLFQWGCIVEPSLFYTTDFLEAHALAHKKGQLVVDRLVQIHPTTRTTEKKKLDPRVEAQRDGQTLQLSKSISSQELGKQIAVWEEAQYLVGRHQPYLHSLSFPLHQVWNLHFHSLTDFLMKLYYQCTGIQVFDVFIKDKQVNQAVTILPVAHIFNVLCLSFST